MTLEQAFRELCAREQALEDMRCGTAVAVLLETLPEEEQ